MGIKIKDTANSALSLWSMPTDLNLGHTNILPLVTLPSLLLASSKVPKFLDILSYSGLPTSLMNIVLRLASTLAQPQEKLIHFCFNF